MRRKLWKKIFVIIMAMIASVSLFSTAGLMSDIGLVSVQAADRVIFKKLNEGTWVKNKGQNYTYDYYKITVASAGTLEFSLAKSDKARDVKLYNTKADAQNRKTLVLEGSFKDFFTVAGDTVKKSVAVDRGTYYLVIGAGVKIKYSFAKVVNKTNYSRGRAIQLKAREKITIAQSPKMNYSRWYKITTTKKQQITYWSNTAGNARQLIEIYNSKGQILQLVNAGLETKYCTKDILPKGTYLIRVLSSPVYSYMLDYGFGNVITLKWR